MHKMSKQEFFEWLLVRPTYMLGQEIILKSGQVAEIVDISLGGGFIYVKQGTAESWIDKENVPDEVVLTSVPFQSRDSRDFPKKLTVGTIGHVENEINEVGTTANHIHSVESDVSELKNKCKEFESSAAAQYEEFKAVISSLKRTVAGLKREIKASKETSKTGKEGGAKGGKKERNKEKQKGNKKKSRSEPEEQTGAEAQPMNVLETVVRGPDDKPVEGAGET